MIYESYTVQSIDKIKNKLSDYSLGQSAEAHHYFDSLPSNNRDKYISDYENFWYTIFVISNIINDLHYSSRSLEDIRIERDELHKTREREKFLNGLGSRLDEVRYYSKNFYNNICILLLFIKDNNLLSDTDLKKNYPELNYTRLLRNDFIQHPNLSYAFQALSSSSIPGNKKEVPYTQIGPGGGGWAFISKHNQAKIFNTSFLAIQDGKKSDSNKKDFIDIGGWKNVFKNKDNDLLLRIKTYGLPSINQKQLSVDIEEIFEIVIFPYIEKLITDAEGDNILFD